MQSSIHNRNETYSKVRAWRGSSARSTTSKLVTPVGTYFGSDVLEGFAADAEFLGRKSEKCDQFDNEFYNLCKEDNMFIFTFHGEDEVKIPAMTIADLENILFKKMKTGKACDIYHLTVEHIREAGLEAKLIILAANCPTEFADDLHARHPEVTKFRASMVNRELGIACGKPFSVSTLSIIDAGDSDLLTLESNIE